MKLSKKALLFIILACFVPPRMFGQSTTVSGTVQDSPDNQTWNNGTIVAVFTPNQNYPAIPQYTWTGGTLNQTISGTLNGAGAYSISIPSNTAITPVGSTWSIKFCPQATAPCFYQNSVTVTGATQTLNITPPSIRINLFSGYPVSAYSTGEILGAPIGSTFYLLGTGLQVCSAVSGNTCTTWTSAGAGIPGGSTGQIQFNNSGAFGGTTATWDTTNNRFLAPNGTDTNPAYSFTNATGSGLDVIASCCFAAGVNGNDIMGWTTTRAVMGSGIGLGWQSSANLSGATADTGLARSAAGVVTVDTSTIANALGTIKPGLYASGTNCSSSASPAVCAAAAAGSVAVAAAATTETVNTTAVTANSQIILTRDDSLGTKLGVTCNTATVMGEMKVSARTGGTSFTITVQTAPATNPGCVSYWIIN